MYHVIKAFTDLEDDGYVYQENDNYPRTENKNVTKERLEALSTTENLRKEVLIERISFKDMDIKNLVYYTKIFGVKIPKGSKKEEIIALLEEQKND